MFFTLEKIEKQLIDLRAAISRQAQEIPRFKFREGFSTLPGEERQTRVHLPDYDDRSWEDFDVGRAWGGYDRVAWFRAWVEVPSDWRASFPVGVDVPPDWRKQKLALRLHVGPRDGGESAAEAMVYVNGEALQALDLLHTEAWLPEEVWLPGNFHLAIKAWSGVVGVPHQRRFASAHLVWVDEPTEKFTYLCSTLVQAAKTLPEGDLRRVRLTRILNQAFDCIDFLQPASDDFYRSVAAAHAYLQAEVERLRGVDEIKARVVGIGHAHLDVGWQWQVIHSRDKAARTFSTALHLMRQYPEYRFLHSTPQVYKYLKADYPEIYARVKEKIASGQWEITGGMWVEADTNLTSGESLVRQILHGKRFVREEFGVEMSTLWLPDVFGYSGALPQIILKSGLKYFVTSKISWSQFNRFPYDTFLWRGLDGSQVLTHFITTPDENYTFYTYSSVLSPFQVQGAWEQYHQKDANDELLAPFGWGDGGGGPTAEMLESARALQNLPGLPQVCQDTVENFMQRLDRRVAGAGLPVWDGELYLEYHRGTYTSQAANKRANRKAEVLYHDSEWLNSLACAYLDNEHSYPAGDLRQGWELILLNQFHDILPGSSIRQVYEDSQADYRQVQHIGQQALEHAQKAILDRIDASTGRLVVWNSLSWDRDGLVEVPLLEGAVQPAGLDALVYQVLPESAVLAGEHLPPRALVHVCQAPALGYRAYPEVGSIPAASSIEPQPAALSISTQEIETPFYRLQLNPQGQITSLWDKRHERQVLASGARGNVLQAFEDRPMSFDAWDIDIYYQEKMREVASLVESAVEETGPLRGTLRLVWQFAASTITQRISVYSHSPRIDFRTQVDWHEHQVLLKAAFPVAVRSTRATYDIQFGNLERPTHWNTSWDVARFESVGHKWVDLSEGDYGVALLNDCKYGHDIHDNTLRLTLIKSAIDPDPQADQGSHEFVYSLLPHGGDWRSGGVVQAAYELNYPLRAAWLAPSQSAARRDLPASGQFAWLDSDHVILETVKQAEEVEEGAEAFVVRVYEYKQSRSSRNAICFGRPLRRAVECNLVEEGEQPVDFEGRTLWFAITPYEIKTFKVWF